MARCAFWSSIVLTNIGFILICVCIGTNNWVNRFRSSLEANEGLFFRCVKDAHLNGDSHKKCSRLYNNFDDFPALYTAILFLMLGACLLHLVQVIVSLFTCCLDEPPSKLICALEIASVMAAATGLSAYVRFYDNKYYGLGWSYIVGWVGVCFVSVGFVAVIIGIEKKRHTFY